MIKVAADRLCDKPIHISTAISFPKLCEIIQAFGEKAGLPLRITEDSIKIGGGLFVKPEPCLVVYNAEHIADYYGYALVQRQQGNAVFLFLYLTGNSKNYSKQIISENTQGFMGKLLAPNNRKQQMENMYYELVKDAIAEALAEYLKKAQ